MAPDPVGNGGRLDECQVLYPLSIVAALAEVAAARKRPVKKH
jgi:hypothetical protein